MHGSYSILNDSPGPAVHPRSLRAPVRSRGELFPSSSLAERTAATLAAGATALAESPSAHSNERKRSAHSRAAASSQAYTQMDRNELRRIIRIRFETESPRRPMDTAEGSHQNRAVGALHTAAYLRPKSAGGARAAADLDRQVTRMYDAVVPQLTPTYAAAAAAASENNARTPPARQRMTELPGRGLGLGTRLRLANEAMTAERPQSARQSPRGGACQLNSPKLSSAGKQIPKDQLRQFGYATLGPIAAGVFSQVIRAKNLQTKQEVAVKTFLMRSKGGKEPPPLESVQAEIECLRMLQASAHANIANLIATHEGQFEVHLILQYCAGGSLARILQTRGHGNGMDEPAAAALLVQVGGALAHMHKVGVAHRDVKPGNVVYSGTSRQQVRLVDFGFAAIFRVNGGSTCKKLKTLCGSPAYMAPELVRGGQYLAPPVDAWALGCVAFEMMHNRVPFRAESMPTLNARILKGSYDKFSPKVSKGLRAMIKKLLAVDTSERLSAAAFTAKLRQRYEDDDDDLEEDL